LPKENTLKKAFTKARKTADSVKDNGENNSEDDSDGDDNGDDGSSSDFESDNNKENGSNDLDSNGNKKTKQKPSKKTAATTKKTTKKGSTKKTTSTTAKKAKTKTKETNANTKSKSTSTSTSTSIHANTTGPTIHASAIPYQFDKDYCNLLEEEYGTINQYNTYSEGMIKDINAKTPLKLVDSSIQAVGEICSMAISNDHNLLVSCSTIGDVSIHDIDSYRQLRRMTDKDDKSICEYLTTAISFNDRYAFDVYMVNINYF